MRPQPKVSKSTGTACAASHTARGAIYVTVLLTFAVFAACLTMTGCGHDDSQVAEVDGIPVELAEVTARPVIESTSLTGVLNAYREVDLVSEVSGEIVALHHDVGAEVRKGAALASIEKKVHQENLNAADAALMAAEARYTLARSDFVRDSTLHANGDIAQAAFDAGMMAYRSALADLNASRASRELAARALRESDIRSPFSGFVSRRFCDVGTYVAPGMPLFRVVNIDSLRLILSVSQAVLGRLSPDTEVSISVEGLGDRVFNGRVRSIAPEADEMTRTFPVEVILVNPEGRPLRDGHVVRADLVLQKTENTVTVPRESVVELSGDDFVFVVEDSVALRRPVEVGSLIEDHYIIEKGLRPGERLVVAGMRNLKDGSRVILDAMPLESESTQGETP